MNDGRAEGVSFGPPFCYNQCRVTKNLHEHPKDDNLTTLVKTVQAPDRNRSIHHWMHMGFHKAVAAAIIICQLLLPVSAPAMAGAAQSSCSAPVTTQALVQETCCCCESGECSEACCAEAPDRASKNPPAEQNRSRDTFLRLFSQLEIAPVSSHAIFVKMQRQNESATSSMAFTSFIPAIPFSCPNLPLRI